LHTHRALTNGILNEIISNHFDSTLRVLGKTVYIYDPFLREMFIPLLTGGRFFLVGEEIYNDSTNLLKTIKQYAINLIVFVPSHLEAFIHSLEEVGDFESLRGITIFCCGEYLKSYLRNKLVKDFHINICYQYGVSELSQVLYSYKYRLNEVVFSISNNNFAYVLNYSLQITPPGGIGELYIGGVGLARGYLNLPELTAERFIANPFQAEEERIVGKNTRLYKTGDLVRYLPDGSIEYIGRNDFQVKIRGYRIELGEIESRLSTYPGINQSVVLVKEHGAQNGENRYLAAYYVSSAPLEQDAILDYLSEYLPEYMVPSVLVWLDRLPLTINGKLDRTALPDPEFKLSYDYVAPRNDLEQKVCEIYAKILGLSVDKISINDDFFRLGGNSILAIKLASQLNNRIFNNPSFDIAHVVNVAEIFSNKTILRLLDHVLGDEGSEAIVIPRLNYNKQQIEQGLDKAVTLSFAQERLWFLDQYEGGSNSYNIPLLRCLSDEINLDQLASCLKAVVCRHEILHSIIKMDRDGNAYQEVCDLETTPITINHFMAATEVELYDFVKAEVNYIFNLKTIYPLRISFIEDKNSRKNYLLVVFHHIVVDGWSLDIFLRDLHAYYDYFSHSQTSADNKYSSPLNLPELTIRYRDFAVWQRAYLSGKQLASELAYWKTKLSGFEVLDLPIEKCRSGEINYSGDNLYFLVDSEVSAKLRKLAREYQVSLYSLLLAGFNLLLRSYSNQDDIVVGTPIANRHHQQLENIIGFFVNSLVLRSLINSEQTLASYIKNVGHNVTQAQLHQDLPFEKLVAELDFHKDQTRHPIFQVMFGVQSFGKSNNDNMFSSIDKDNISLYRQYKAARFDLTVMLDDSEAEIKGSFNYATSLFTEETISGYIATYKHILTQISIDSNKKISKLTYLDEETYKQVIYDWNQTYKDYSQNKTIHQLFEEQVQKTPDNLAIVFEEVKLTYNDLNIKANQLTHYLQYTYKIKGDDIIALCVNRSEQMLILILASLKSGAAYVPIDPNYPEERIRYILGDTKAKVVLADTVSSAKLVKIVKKYELISNIEEYDSINLQKILSNYPKLNPLNEVSIRNLAYVIYTSGTTGNPKGVMIEHAGVTNLLNAEEELLGLSKSQNGQKLLDCLWCASYVFDAHVWDLFVAICHGHVIHIVNDTVRQDFVQLSKYIDKYSIYLATIPPALLQSDHILRLHTLVVAGDKTEQKVLDYYTNNNVNVINAYGPSESTVCATLKHFKLGDLNTNIGTPIANITAYVLDASLCPLPIGGIGELYVGGAGLARGYLNLPELTAKQFIANPFQTEAQKKTGINTRLYKTGDLVRYLPDGNLEYIGRNDFQVKIRGFRIELGEIEAQLTTYPEIKQAVALALEHLDRDGNLTGNKYLAAYYVAKARLDETAILNYLHQELPDYMLPNILVYLDKLPLTINGKLDRTALPNPEFIDATHEYIAPRDELDKSLVNIFATVLGLDVDRLSINADFFRLGGHSILAVKLVNQLNKHISEAKLSVADIFKYKNIEKLSDYIVHHASNANYQEVKINKYNLLNPEGYKLSFAQERLWFIDNLEQGTNAYNVPLLLKLSENINEEYLFKALEDTVKRHEVLRSVIKLDANANAYQEILEFGIQSLINKHIHTSAEELHRNLTDNCNYVFKLDSEYPIKIDFYQSTNSIDKVLAIVVHHIAFDGWSVDVLLHEVNEGYKHYQELGIVDAKQNHQAVDVYKPGLAIQYKDYALWQREYLSGEILATQLDYWKNQLSGYESLHLMTDKPRPLTMEYAGANVYFKLDKVISAKLRELSKELGVSLYSILLGSYYLLLSAYSNQTDIVIGTPVANRHYTDLENMIGFFVNTLALRCEIDKKQTVFQYLSNIGNKVIDAQMHQDLPFEKLVGHLNVEKDVSRHPIFQIMFGVQSFGGGNTEAITKPGAKEQLFEPYTPSPFTVAKFDITTMINDSASELTGSFNYRVNLYNHSTIENLINTYKIILENIVKSDKQTQLSKINFLNKEEYHNLVVTYNQTEKDYPQGKTIHQLFEEQVAKTPNNIAVVYEDIRLTYEELNRKANQLANYLRDTYHIKGDDLIALCLDRSEHMLVTIFGVLKSGGAYVPIDPSYPDERISYILKDTNVKVLITDSQCHSRAHTRVGDGNPFIDILTIDNNEFTQVLKKYPNTNPEINISSRNLAYVIYTSGTTGKPKGVMLQHQGIINRIKWMNDEYPLTEQDKILQKTPYVFDVSVWELFWGVWYGATIVFAKPGGHKDSEYRLKLMIQEKISIVHFVPSMLGGFTQTLELMLHNSHINLDTLRYMFCSGENLPLSYIKDIRKLLPTTKIHNLYGPTEASVDVLYYDCNMEDIGEIYIGKPIANTTCYILDNNLNLLPIGSIGELYLGGVGLARGYLNLPELTKERFLANPFQTKSQKQSNTNTRIYKTGDLVRMLPDGNIEYIGRNDFQVKIRGYRIELGEIESQLLGFPGVKQSIVLAFEHLDANGLASGNKYLAAYYVAETKLDEVAILNYLLDLLPDYMVPMVLAHLESLPLTVSGKLDRGRLPAPEVVTDINNYLAPRNDMESKICDIYAEVLGLPIDKIGINDDFFHLGGDSIISIQLVTRLRKYLGLNISVKDVFTQKTVAALAGKILSVQDNVNYDDNMLLKENEILTGMVELLPIQEWFFDKIGNGLFKKPGHWNQSFLIKTEALDQKLLKYSLIKLIEYHDCFRLNYSLTSGNNYKQFYNLAIDYNELDIEYLNISGLSDAELQQNLTDWQSNFDLFGRSPLYRIGYLDGYEDGSSRIFFALHHLLVDAVSWRIITRDLQALYGKLHQAHENGVLNKVLNESSEKLLGSKGTSYRQWSNLAKEYAQMNKQERSYWQLESSALDATEKSLLSMVSNESEINHAEFVLDEKTTSMLIGKCNKAYNTEINDILLSAFGLSLAKISGNNVNYTSLEGHGREEIVNNIDITKTVGWFTTIYPVCLKVFLGDLHQTIISIKEQLRAIPNKGIGYGALFGYVNPPLPRVNFNYLGQIDQDTKVGSNYWGIVKENSGVSMSTENQDNSILNANGLIMNGKLRFIMNSKLSKEYFVKLVAEFKNNLNELALYLENRNKLYYSVTDFSHDFDDIYTVIDKSNNDPNAKITFIFPPGNGGYESYLSTLVPGLTGNKFVLFNNYYLHIASKINVFSENNNIDFTFLAKFYMQFIKKIQPNGPYNLFGWSFGGILSFEVARELELAGDKVASLGLLDSFFDYKFVADELGLMDKFYLNNINYKYTPDHYFYNKSKAKIIFYKATQATSPEELNNELNLDGYDANKDSTLYTCYINSECNFINKYLDISLVKIIKINANHLNWVSNVEVKNKICNYLSKK